MSEQYLSSRLRHRVTLQQPSGVADGAGGITRSWVDVADLWAEIIPIANRTYVAEQVVDGHQQSRVFHKVTLRYRDGVTADMRLLFEGRIFLIRQVATPDERRAELTLMCEEGPLAG